MFVLFSVLKISYGGIVQCYYSGLKKIP